MHTFSSPVFVGIIPKLLNQTNKRYRGLRATKCRRGIRINYVSTVTLNSFHFYFPRLNLPSHATKAVNKLLGRRSPHYGLADTGA